MRVLEIKNNLVKIAYDAADNLALSSFVIIEDVNTPYVAQVMNIKADTVSNYAIVKLLFTFDQEGILKNYNGTIPSLKSTVTKLPSNELLDIIPIETPIKMGELAQQKVELKVDKTVFDNNLLICSNNAGNTNIILNNITKQINDKTVIFDTDGQFGSEEKLVFGTDFKLPLNYDTINFIYDNDLEDVDTTSKAIIQDIFLEVQEYTKTLPEGYLPFETFLNVVDQQYRETQITQLILLKNKLLKYKELNVFAETLKDVLDLSIAIEKSDRVVIDISNIPENLQKETISYIYKVMNNINATIYSFVKVNNTNSSKKLLKTLIARTNVYTTIICPHEYKYINEVKEIAQNLILFAPLTLQHDFSSYNTFLNKLNSGEYIIYGAHTQNIPLIVELTEINVDKQENQQENINADTLETSQNTTEEKISTEPAENPQEKQKEEIEEKISIEEEEKPEYPAQIEYPDITVEEVSRDNPEETELISLDENIEIVDTPQPIPNILADDDSEPQVSAETANTDKNTETNIEISEEITTDNSETGYPEPEISIEEPEIDYSIDETDIQTDFNSQDINNHDEIVEQVSKDVDRAFYEKLPDDNIIVENLEEPEIDELTEDDLNLIGDITSENYNDDNEGPEIEENSTPIVPVYPADDIEPAVNTLEPGDRVSTPKYGEGVVEKMIKYGNKTLCSIEFPNIGRRLLDPAMTEITKLEA